MDFSTFGSDVAAARTAAEGALRDADASPAAVASVSSAQCHCTRPVFDKVGVYKRMGTWYDPSPYEARLKDTDIKQRQELSAAACPV